jgi:hypothetical protein
MSNDLILSIKNRLAEIGGEIDEDTRAVAGSSGGVKRISIKGGVFRKYVGGKEVAAIEDRHMNVIFVKMAHNPSRNYYSQGYQEGARVSPSCWSADSKTPDPEVTNPQAASCDRCPRSVKGSGQGGTGTACRLQWRTAVVLPNDVGGDVMQLTLPPTSCFGEGESGRLPFRPYIQYLANNNISAGRVVTRMQFDTKSPVPRVLFNAVEAVDPDDMQTIVLQGKSQAAETAIKLTVFQADAPVQAPRVRDSSQLELPLDTDEDEVEVQAEEMPEPVKRETKKAGNSAEVDVPDVIAKWSKKG